MALRVLSSAVCGPECSFLIGTDGVVTTFGFSEEGAHGCEETLVNPPNIIVSLSNIVSISCGESHTVCLDNSGVVFSFGSNYFGQLGVNKDNQVLGNTHEPQKIDLPLVKQISAGNTFTFCISEDGDAFFFGLNDFFEEDKEIIAPIKVDTLKNIDFVTCGCEYAIFKTMDGSIYVWFENRYGQLGIGNTQNQNTPFKCDTWPDDVVDIKCGNTHTLVLTSKQEVFSCGDNESGKLGRKISGSSPSLEKIDSLSNITRIECGYNHSMCIGSNGELFLFGNNAYGQVLGVNDKEIPSSCFSDIIDISSGGLHTFVKNSANEIYAFGKNNCSQLGIKTEEDEVTNPIMVFEDDSDVWYSNINKPKAKSANSIFHKEEDEKIETEEKENNEQESTEESKESINIPETKEILDESDEPPKKKQKTE